LQNEGSLIFTSKAPLKEITLDAMHELPLVVPPPEATVDQLRQEISRLNVVGEADKALQIYAKAKPATLEKLGASQLFTLGMSLFDGGYHKESLQAFQKCAASEKKTDPVYKLLGWVWQGHLLDLLDRRDEAVTSYQQALQYCDSNTDIRHDQYGMRITKSWVEKRTQSPFQRPDPKILELRNRINDLQWTGQGDQALSVFNETKSISRADSGLPWGKLALCLYDGKHYAEALQAFKNDLAEHPTAFASLVWQGHLLDLMNQRAEAITCYKQAIEMNPTSWVRHDQYGIKIDHDWIQERMKTPFQRSDSPTPAPPGQGEPSPEP
jgi:tetratricopeptide (TPR) repeat protein